MKKYINYFLQGLLLLGPIVITIWAITTLFDAIDGVLKDTITNIFGFSVPGLGLIILLLVITLVGYLGSTIMFKPIIYYFDRFLARTPFIKIIYTSVKDLIAAFVGHKKRFTQPVLVRIGENTRLERVGFITNNDLSVIGLPDKKVAVYLPHSYAWSGNLVIVPSEYISKIDATSTEAMKFIISAGVTNVE